MTDPRIIRDKALELAASCRELDQMIKNNPDLEILPGWDWLEEPGDDVFEELALRIEIEMRDDW